MVGQGRLFAHLKRLIESRFNMDRSTILEWYLGINFTWKEESFEMGQTLYVRNIHERFSKYLDNEKIERCTPLPDNYKDILTAAEKSTEKNPNFPYRSIIGSIMYAMLGTRPDLTFAVH